MKIKNSDSCRSFQQERTLGEVPCFNCGRLVTVTLPLFGCVFCVDCQKDTGQWDGTEQFYDKRRNK